MLGMDSVRGSFFGDELSGMESVGKVVGDCKNAVRHFKVRVVLIHIKRKAYIGCQRWHSQTFTLLGAFNAHCL